MAFICTYTNEQVDFDAIKPNDLHLTDIAQSLSQLCRFNGHTNQFYSVAEHSALIANKMLLDGMKPAQAYAGLMHDAHEAYVGDCSRPLKSYLGDKYTEITEQLEAALDIRFQSYCTEHKAFWAPYDDDLLMWEAQHFFPGAPWVKESKMEWPRLMCYDPAAARHYFLTMHAKLTLEMQR